MNPAWINAIFGGVLIGLAVSLMLFLTGRVAGISGITNGLLSFNKNDFNWRLAFVFGLVAGGFILKLINPDFFLNLYQISTVQAIAAGLLVGFGTIMGSGCTSGHGVCGISRLSVRSILATLVFIFAGVLTVYVLRAAGVIV